MPPDKPDWREFALFDDADLNLMCIEAEAKKLGIEPTEADREQMKQVAREMADLFIKLRAALIANDNDEVLRLGREICRLPPRKNGEPLV